MRCFELRAEAHGGLGNQLLFILSVAILSEWARIGTCTIRLATFRYGDAVSSLLNYMDVRRAAWWVYKH